MELLPKVIPRRRIYTRDAIWRPKQPKNPPQARQQTNREPAGGFFLRLFFLSTSSTPLAHSSLRTRFMFPSRLRCV